MKKLLLAGFVLTSSLFATSLEDRVNALEKRVNALEKKLNIVNKKQKELKKDIVENSIPKCNKLKIKNYSFKYINNVLVKSYNFKYVLENDYNKTVKYVYARISYIDKDKVQMVEDYIKKSIRIEPHQQVTIKTNYLIDEGSLSETLKDTPKKDIKIEFKPFEIDFEDGQTLKCQ